MLKKITSGVKESILSQVCTQEVIKTWR